MHAVRQTRVSAADESSTGAREVFDPKKQTLRVFPISERSRPMKLEKVNGPFMDVRKKACPIAKPAIDRQALIRFSFLESITDAYCETICRVA